MPWPAELAQGGPLLFTGEARLHVHGPVPPQVQADCLRRVQAALLPHTVARRGATANAQAHGATFALHLEVTEAGADRPHPGSDESYALQLDAAGARLCAANRFGLSGP